MGIKVGLPDGSHLTVDEGATLRDVAAAIGPRLARAALAGKINGRLMDLATPVSDGENVCLVTFADAEGREAFRHTSAHVMAHAVKRLMPDAHLEDGPPLEDGFFYDIETLQPLTPEDLAAVEAEMAKIVAADLPIRRREILRELKRLAKTGRACLEDAARGLVARIGRLLSTTGIQGSR